jgi:hypothetical protein
MDVVVVDKRLRMPGSMEELERDCAKMLGALRNLAALTGMVKSVAVVLGEGVFCGVCVDPRDEEEVRLLKGVARSFGCIIYVFGARVGNDYSLMALGYTPAFKVHLRNPLQVDSEGRVTYAAPTYEFGEAEGVEFFDPWGSERVGEVG